MCSPVSWGAAGGWGRLRLKAQAQAGAGAGPLYGAEPTTSPPGSSLAALRIAIWDEFNGRNIDQLAPQARALRAADLCGGG